MNKENIKALIEKYYRAETSLEEEEMLREYFSVEENKADDPELAELLAMYSQFETLSTEEELREFKVESAQKSYSIPWYYSIAAAVAFLIVGVFFGRGWNNDQVSSQQIANLNQQINDIKTMISYQQVEKMSPSEKIQVAYQFKGQDSLDVETVNTLISILQFDENLNVRLAAAEALSKFKNNDRVRSAFLKSLKTETNPVLQIKLIDVLIMSKETKALPEFERIMKASNENETVKQRAAYGISQLI